MKYQLVEDVDALPGPKLVFYVITHGTKDHGDKYVLRRQVAGKSVIYVEKGAVGVRDTLAQVRTLVPDGLVRMPRVVGDDPVIMETWM